MEKEVKEKIYSICYGCISFPLCSQVCEKYFDTVNNFIGKDLYRPNWIGVNKSVCDGAVNFIWRVRRLKGLENEKGSSCR